MLAATTDQRMARLGNRTPVVRRATFPHRRAAPYRQRPPPRRRACHETPVRTQRPCASTRLGDGGAETTTEPQFVRVGAAHIPRSKAYLARALRVRSLQWSRSE